MPIAAAIPAIIGAAGAIGSSALSASAARGDTGAARGTLGGVASNVIGAGNEALGTSLPNLNNVANFYRTLMSGNLQQIQNMLGPEISQVGQQYNQIANSSAQLQPRQGLSTAARAELPFQKEATIGNAILAAPLTGASGLANTSGIAGQLGTNLYGISGNVGNSLANLGLGVSGQGLSQAPAGYQIGQSIGANVPWGKIFGSTSGSDIVPPGGFTS